MALDEIQANMGAMDAPDPRDFNASHIFGVDATIKLPASVNLNLVPSHDQGHSFHCTSYGLTHIVEILNTIEHSREIKLDPEEQWKNQLRPPPDLQPGAVEDVGDSLQHALKIYMRDGLTNNENIEIETKVFTATGYAFVDKNLVQFKRWLASSFPIYTGWNAHCFALVGYDDTRQVFIAKNSYGPRAGAHGDGTFDIPYTDLPKLFSGYIIYDTKDLTMIFKDVSTESPMAKGIQKMLDLGLMRGYGVSDDPKERLFMPNAPITRAEVATVIANLIDKFMLIPKN